MKFCWTVSLVVTFLFCSCYGYVDLPVPWPSTETYQLRMSGANPTSDEAYLCTTYKLDSEKEMYPLSGNDKFFSLAELKSGKSIIWFSSRQYKKINKS